MLARQHNAMKKHDDSDEQPEPWERQAWDTNASYEAFKNYYLPAASGVGRLIRAYRAYEQDMAEKKGQTAVGGETAENEHGIKKTKKPRNPKNKSSVSGTWSAWHRGLDRHGQRIEGVLTWAERAAAFDRVLVQKELAELAQKKAESKAKRLELLEGVMGKIIDLWALVDFKPKPGPDGKITSPSIPKFKDIVSATHIVFDELRTEHNDGPKSPPNQNIDLSLLTSEQLERLSRGEDIYHVLRDG